MPRRGSLVLRAAALIREDEAFDAFRARVAGLEGAQLDERLGNGDTVEAVIRYDGPDHYAEHTEHLRAWFDADLTTGSPTSPYDIERDVCHRTRRPHPGAARSAG